MDRENDNRVSLLPGDYQNTELTPRQRMTKARGQLYELIADFRKKSSTIDDDEAQLVLELGVEVISGLVRAFKQYDHFATMKDAAEQPVSDDSPNGTNGSTPD